MEFNKRKREATIDPEDEGGEFGVISLKASSADATRSSLRSVRADAIKIVPPGLFSSRASS